jgi:hypothetical protein
MPFKEWIICYVCHQMGHIARHCFAQTKEKPNHLDANLGNTERKIWLTKEAHAGGVMGSRQTILEELNHAQPNPLSPFPNTELQISSRSQNPAPLPSTLESPLKLVMSLMTYQRVDPRPFAPHGFQPLEVQHREMMVHVVAQFSPPTHEDLTKVSIAPILGNILQFPLVHEVIHEFLEEHMNVLVRDIQLSHLGQALVRLVNHSPHPYRGVEFHVVRHNQGRN